MRPTDASTQFDMTQRKVAKAVVPLPEALPVKLGGARGGGRFGLEDVERARDFLARVISAAVQGRETRSVTGAVNAAKAILEQHRWTVERDDRDFATQLAELLGDDEKAEAWLFAQLEAIEKRKQERAPMRLTG